MFTLHYNSAVNEDFEYPKVAVERPLGIEGEAANPLCGLFGREIGGKRVVVEYEADGDLRDSEQVPLGAEGGIEKFLSQGVDIHRRMLGIISPAVKIGYEIGFTRYFHKPQSMRTLEEIRADVLALEREGEGYLTEIIGESK